MKRVREQIAIRVAPAEARLDRARLWAALEALLPVRFIGDDKLDRPCEAAVLFTDSLDSPLIADLPRNVPRLALLETRGAPVSSGRCDLVELADDPHLDRRLRGKRISDKRAGELQPLPVKAGDVVLGEAAGAPLWIVRPGGAAPFFAAASVPLELGEGEPLRSVLRSGDFLSLLPLVEFLRSVSAAVAWTPPPQRATFIVDDPNLHWPSYGYINYADLAKSAKAHGYHVTIAMVPLDGWAVHPRAAAIFRESSVVLSLAVHGTSHLKRELAAPTTETEARRSLAVALRRLQRFETRAQVPVARVMVPPHGVCSAATLGALAELGFDAGCYASGVLQSADPRLAGCTPATLTERGFPVILRRIVTSPMEEFLFHGYLDQPLVVCGHHEDFSEGAIAFREAAAIVERLADVQWHSLGAIAETNFASRQDGERLRLRPYSRRLRVPIPEDVSVLTVEKPPGWDTSTRDVVTVEAMKSTSRTLAAIQFGEPLRVQGNTQLLVRLVRRTAATVPPTRTPWHPWPITRRVLAEGRDRLRPLLSRGRS